MSLKYSVLYDINRIDIDVLEEIKNKLQNEQIHTELFIQTLSKKENIFWSQCCKLLEIDKELSIRFGIRLDTDDSGNFINTWGDLRFLSDLSTLKNLTIEGYVDDLEVLKNFCTLTKFGLVHRNKNKIDLNYLINISSTLKILTLGGKFKNTQVVSKLKNIKQLSLTSVNFFDIEYLENCKNLNEINFFLNNNIVNYSKLDALTRLEKLRFYRNMKLSNLDFILQIKNLNEIEIDGLKNLNELPDFSQLKNLKKLTLMNMNYIKNVEIISQAKQLKQIEISNCMNPRKDFDFLQTMGLDFYRVDSAGF